MANAMISNLVRVMTKARKQRGIEYPSQPTDYSVDFASKRGFITIYKDDKNGVPVKGATFRVGCSAEYDSYNLSYVGEISKITEKCVTIIAYKGFKYNEQTHRLDMNSFCYRNWDFDAERIAAHNANEMMYI